MTRELMRDQARPWLAAIPERARPARASPSGVARPGLALHRRRRLRLAAQTERWAWPTRASYHPTLGGARVRGRRMHAALAAESEHRAHAPAAHRTPQRSAITRFAAIVRPTNADAAAASPAGTTGAALPRPAPWSRGGIQDTRTAGRAGRIRDGAERRSPVLPSGWRQNRNAAPQASSSETSPCPSPAAMGLPP